MTLQDYADHCEAHSDIFESLLEQLTVVPAGRSPDDQPTYSPRERDRAYAKAAEIMTDPSDPEVDLLPIVAPETLASLDTLSQRDLAKNYLIAAVQVYDERSSASRFLSASALGSKVVAATTTMPVQVGVTEGPTIAEAWARYIEDQTHRKTSWKTTGTPEKAKLAFQDLIQLVGDKQLTTVDRSDLKRYVRFQEHRPSGNVRKYRGVNALKLEAMDIPADERQSGTNASHKLVEITRFFKWCLHEQLIEKNPGENLAIAQDEGSAVEVWTDAEIRALLDPRNLWAHSGLQDERSTVAYLPWAIVLGLYTGARLGEIVGVRLQDFHRRDPHSEGEVPAMIVDEYDDKTLKTKNARRKIPLHPDLEALGLWEYIAARNEAGATMLLDCPTKSGSRPKHASQRFTRYTQRLGLHKERVKVFHSFRHGFKTKLAGYLNKAEVDFVLGHTRGDSNDTTYIKNLLTSVHRHYDGVHQMRFDLPLDQLRTFLVEPRDPEVVG